VIVMKRLTGFEEGMSYEGKKEMLASSYEYSCALICI
jgi:hypothetical protein